jgi:hypothetical protein
MKKPQGILPCGLSFRGNFGSSRAGRVHPNNGESFLANKKGTEDMQALLSFQHNNSAPT